MAFKNGPMSEKQLRAIAESRKERAVRHNVNLRIELSEAEADGEPVAFLDYLRGLITNNEQIANS